MTAPSTSPKDSHQAIGQIAQLLHQASEQTWHHAAPEPLRVSLGLGIYLAHAQTNALLPVDYQIPSVEVDDRPVGQLLRDAEHLTRNLMLHRAGTAEISVLVVTLCDLIREASHLER